MRVNEFSTKPMLTSFCQKSICSEYYLQGINGSAKTDWWINLSSRQWLRCPVPECLKLLPITHEVHMEVLLRQFGDRDAENNIAA